MTLKELYEKKGASAFTLSELEAAMKEHGVKFADLAEGKYVDKGKYDADLASRDSRITELDGTIKQRDTDLADLSAKLTAAGEDSAKLAAANQQIADLTTKYEQATADYNAKLAARDYEQAVKAFADSQKFTSQAAKRDFVAALTAKKLTVDNGTLIGAKDFVETYAKDNADAFAKDDNNQGNQDPYFAGPTGNKGGTPPEDPFGFKFTGVRPH